MTEYKGKCSDCGNKKTLDIMVRKEAGLYHCTDCVVQEVNTEYEPLFDTGSLSQTPLKKGTIQKLIGWCFG